MPQASSAGLNQDAATLMASALVLLQTSSCNGSVTAPPHLVPATMAVAVPRPAAATRLPACSTLISRSLWATGLLPSLRSCLTAGAIWEQPSQCSLPRHNHHAQHQHNHHKQKNQQQQAQPSGLLQTSSLMPAAGQRQLARTAGAPAQQQVLQCQ